MIFAAYNAPSTVTYRASPRPLSSIVYRHIHHHATQIRSGCAFLGILAFGLPTPSRFSAAAAPREFDSYPAPSAFALSPPLTTLLPASYYLSHSLLAQVLHGTRDLPGIA